MPQVRHRAKSGDVLQSPRAALPSAAMPSLLIDGDVTPDLSLESIAELPARWQEIEALVQRR